MNSEFRTAARLSVMRALWGEVSPNVRAVLIRPSGPQAFRIEFYLHGNSVADFVESASIVEGLTTSDFPPETDISHDIIRLDEPGKIPVGEDGLLVFKRREDVALSRSKITLSVNRALLGEAFDELTGVCGLIEHEDAFSLTLFVSREPDDAIVESISCMETEVMADFPANVHIKHQIVHCEHPTLPATDAFWMYLRKARTIEKDRNHARITMEAETTWAFVGEQATLPSGVFSNVERAERWIALHGLSGLLTEYTVGEGAYDWAVHTGHFKPRAEKTINSELISRFTSGQMKHFHYSNGVRTY